MWFFIMAILVISVVWKLTKKWSVGLLIGYVLIILGETIIFRIPKDYYRYQLQLFWSYEIWEKAKEEIIANIFVYTPAGVIAGRLWKWKGILFGIGLSVLTEVLQLVTHRGWFELADLLHNSLGTLIGFAIYIVGMKIFNKVIKRYESLV